MRLHLSAPAGRAGAGARDRLQHFPDSARIDFDLPESTLDKDDLTARLNALIEAGTPVTVNSISPEELAAQPTWCAPSARRRRRADPHHRDPGRGPPALWRHPCRQHQRDRPGGGGQDRKEEPQQPARGDPVPLTRPPVAAALIQRARAGLTSQPRRHHRHGMRSGHWYLLPSTRGANPCATAKRCRRRSSHRTGSGPG